MTDQAAATNHLEDFIRSREGAARALSLVFDQPTGNIPLEEFFPSPLSIPKRKRGKISVTHRIVKGKTPIISMRQAIMSGTRAVTLKLDEPLLIHELRDEDAGVWMTDLPEELHQIAAMLRVEKPRGRVLVGGLGLGILPHFLARRPEVEKVVVIERDLHVIKLIERHLPQCKVHVTHDNITHYLKGHMIGFDHYLLDTWQGTGENVWWTEVLPLKRIIRQRWGAAPKVHCWAEDIMAGQVLPQLVSSSRHWRYEKLPPSMSPEEAAFFFKGVGLPEWEAKYGKLVADPT